LENIPKYLFYFNPNDHSNGFRKQLLVSEFCTNDFDTFNFQKQNAFFINYDFKNRIEQRLKSQNPPCFKTPDFIGIYPELQLSDFNAQCYFEQLIGEVKESTLKFNSISKADYFKQFEKIMHHIQIGDIYEMNYCIVFRAKGKINPYKVYTALNAISHAPFSAFAKLNQQYIISSSPERFLKLENNVLYTEPIKGTSARYLNKKADQESKWCLQNSLKEQTENVMIVDVARNDLSRIAKRNSVKVEQLFGIYSFEQVHQMISKVSCSVKNNISFQDIIYATFPMASMTGAPKIRAMELIDEVEDFSRGAYSSTIGYSESNILDSSVLIRSIFYNMETEDVCFAVGGAITAASNAEAEWNELMLKAKAMQTVLISKPEGLEHD
jgi:para-aminobenzoate synthetase component I